MFVESGGTWTEQAPILSASDGGKADLFGVRVALSGSTIAVREA